MRNVLCSNLVPSSVIASFKYCEVVYEFHIIVVVNHNVKWIIPLNKIVNLIMELEHWSFGCCFLFDVASHSMNLELNFSKFMIKSFKFIGYRNFNFFFTPAVVFAYTFQWGPNLLASTRALVAVLLRKL